MRTVLTVDDSKVVRSMVARHLTEYRCRVLEAANGEEGVRAARQHRPDLILLDVTMPVMDGKEALANLRKDPVCKSIPVIMLTAESGRDTVVELAKLGVSGYILKPFEKESFDKQVSKVLGIPLDRAAVLVADDAERVLEQAREALDGRCTVVTATSGREALERYREARPAVVVIDLALPDMDGCQAFAEIRKVGTSNGIALTIRGNPEAVEQAKTAGFQFVLEKPFPPQALADYVMVASCGTPEELVNLFLGDQDGCPVIDVPDPRSRILNRVIPALRKKLHDLADGGRRAVILDLGKVGEMTSDLAGSLVTLLADASTVGLRTAICSPHERVLESLKQINEMRDVPFAGSRAAARERLG